MLRVMRKYNKNYLFLGSSVVCNEHVTVCFCTNFVLLASFGGPQYQMGPESLV